jgi:hypothetical protein
VLIAGCARSSRSRGVFALAVILLLAQLLAEKGQAGTGKKPSTNNPHGNPALCSACHAFAIGGKDTLTFGANVLRLCESCHDGQHAAREVHPVNLVPSAAILERMPSDFLLEDGKLTCLTCHDVASQCIAGQPTAAPNRNLLRGTPSSDPMVFCFRCHIPQLYKPFNVHDQLEGNKTKADTCQWCHASAPEVGASVAEQTSLALRRTGPELCNNCHSVSADHPAGNPHVHTKPSAQMQSYMAAYEMEPGMHLPFKQLLEYVRAAKRAPKSIPLDSQGRLTCWSCHNPHEEGLLPRWNPRSVGAEPKKAIRHRLRAREGDNACRACHQK